MINIVARNGKEMDLIFKNKNQTVIKRDINCYQTIFVLFFLYYSRWITYTSSTSNSDIHSILLNRNGSCSMGNNVRGNFYHLLLLITSSNSFCTFLTYMPIHIYKFKLNPLSFMELQICLYLRYIYLQLYQIRWSNF